MTDTCDLKLGSLMQVSGNCEINVMHSTVYIRHFGRDVPIETARQNTERPVGAAAATDAPGSGTVEPSANNTSDKTAVDRLQSVSDHIEVMVLCFNGFGHMAPALHLSERLCQVSSKCSVTLFGTVNSTQLGAIKGLVGDNNRVRVYAVLAQAEEDSFIVYVNDVRNGLWEERVKKFYDCQLVDNRAVLIDSNGCHSASPSKQPGWSSAASLALAAPVRRPSVTVPDMFVGYDTGLARHYGIPSWQFHASSVAFLTLGDPRGGITIPGVGDVDPINTENADRFMDLWNMEAAARPFREGILVNDVADWWPHEALELARQRVTRVKDGRNWEVLCVGPLLKCRETIQTSRFDQTASRAPSPVNGLSPIKRVIEQPEQSDQPDEISAQENTKAHNYFDSQRGCRCDSQTQTDEDLEDWTESATASARPDNRTAEDWLNSQKPRSVIFVSMGSQFDLRAADLLELANALEAVNVPVLWALRLPKMNYVASLKSGNDGKSSEVGQKSEEEKSGDAEECKAKDSIDDWLPANYIQRNWGRIRIIHWVDQVAVLKHEAVRVFLSHSGWNGTLEAMSSFEGPIVSLPLGAEQAMNAKIQEEYFKNGLRVWKSGGSCELKETSIREDLRKVYDAFERYSKVSYGLNVVSQFAWKNSSKRDVLKFIDSIPSNSKSDSRSTVIQ
jgi:hypothetical protein